jgi:glycosyltransferase involved in cell wall biosynthesis
MSIEEPITAIMAARDAASTIEAALRSLVNQPELRDVVVVDDGSVDDTAAIVRRLNHPKITLIRLERSIGRAAARNLAATAAQAEFLAVADADDISLPHRLGTLLSLIRDTGAVAVGGQTAHFADDPSRAHVPWSWPTSTTAIQNSLDCGVMPLAHPTMLIRADAFQAVGGYDPSFGWSEDFELITRLAQQGELTASEEIVLLYRRPDRDAWSYMFKSNHARRAAAGDSPATAWRGAALDATRSWLRVRFKPQRRKPFPPQMVADGEE